MNFFNFKVKFIICFIILQVLNIACIFYGESNDNCDCTNDCIVVYIDINYPPYIFVNENNELTGYLYDLWKLFEKTTGKKVIIKAFNWDETLERFKKGEGDIIDTIFYNPERAKWLSFGSPYEKINVPIFYHKSITGINDIKSLKGFSIAVKAGDNVIYYLKQNGISNFILFNSYEEIIKEASFGNIKLFSVDEPAALYYLVKYNIHNEFKIGPILYSGEFHRAVRKGGESLLNYVELSFHRLDKKELDLLRKKWFGIPIISKDFFKIIFIIFFVLVFLFLILIIISVILKNEVEKRTKTLKITLKDLYLEKEKLNLLINSIPEIFFIINKNFTIEQKRIPRDYIKNQNINYERVIDILINDNEIKENILSVLFSKNNKIEKLKEIYIDDRLFFFIIRINPFNYDIQGNIKVKEFNLKKIINLHDKDKIENDIFDILNNERPENYEENLGIKINSVIVYIQDVTEMKKLEENIVKIQKFQMIGTLAGGIAHDFNNILHGISGVVSLIKFNLKENNNISNKDLMEYINIIENSINKGANIVNQILEISRERKEKQEIIELNNVIQNSITVVSSFIHKSVRIIFNPPKDQFYIIGNKTKLEQIFINLLMNANDAMTIMRKDGNIGGEINIDVKKIDKDGKAYYLISIKDNGVGIPEKFKNKIFTPFFTTKTNGKGTGLGLSIVYKLVNSHNGFIEFNSKENVGTTFYIYLPVYYGELTDINGNLDKNLIKGKGRVLLVDDDETITKTTERLLNKCGYDVIVANDGLKGWELFIENKENLSLVILDFIMPGISGKELLKKIKELSPGFKIIFTTGFLEDEKLSEIHDIKQEYKDVIFINKPFNFIELSEKISKLINS